MDNLRFGLSHLAKDGLHFTATGKNILTRHWIDSILKRLGLMHGTLPIRRQFRYFVQEFQSMNWGIG